MNNRIRISAGILLIIIALILFYLANMGVLSFGEAHVYRLSKQLPLDKPPVVFANINLVPMDSEKIFKHQTVVVRNGLIESIGNEEQVHVPADALVIDGTGKYLMPGLTDMHVHIETENDVLLFVANGVTSVRNMWGNTGKKLSVGLPSQLELKEKIQTGALLGPTIYTAGPVMEGEPAFHPLAEVFASPEKAAASIAQQKAQGYDFVKVYDHLSPEVYTAVVEAARENDLPVVGHVPFAVGLDGVLDSGQQTIEHLTGYIDPDAAELIIPAGRLEEYALKTREAGVWNVVTLSEYPKSKETPEGVERLKEQPGMAYVSPGMKLATPFMYKMTARAHTYSGADYPQRIAALNRQMVQALHEANAGILLGTDAAQFYHVPGFAIHEELAMLVEAGLTPYEAIAAGTHNAAVAMGKDDEFGTIGVGKRADMIMLKENPLEDVGNIQKRVGVMLNGRWFTEEQLQSMLNGLRQSYRPSPFDRLWPLALVLFALLLLGRDTPIFLQLKLSLLSLATSAQEPTIRGSRQEKVHQAGGHSP